MATSFKFRAALITGFALFGAVAPMLAHHSFAAEYDSTKTVTIKGTVNHLSWVNPHAYVFVDVKDANGKVTTWAFESLSPNALSRQGWNRNSLKQGEEVTVEGYMAKDNKPLADGSIHANSRGITRADGRKVFVGSSADDVPSK
jgi:tRNA(Ile2) C34 agmatinyltransferase TiaS